MISKDSLELAVFTVRQVVKDKKPILYVVHDKEDNWQFLTDDEVSTEDLMIISLADILTIDPTVQNILWIPEGTEAWRPGVEKEWITKVFSE